MRAVKETEEAWIKTAASKDPAKWASFLAGDAVGLYPGAPTLSGKAAMTRYMSDPIFSLVPHPTQAVAASSGDMVCLLGTYTTTLTNPNTKTVISDQGKYLTVYMKHRNEHLRVAVDTFNSDLQS